MLYEMLTGKRAFEGDEVSETLASVLAREADWTALPTTVGPAIRRLLRRCLEKDRRRRLADAADARLEIEDAATTVEGDGQASPRASSPRYWFTLAIGATALVLGGLIVVLLTWSRVTSSPGAGVTRFAMTLAEGQSFLETGNQVLAISPDGTKVAFVADRRLYLRSMSELNATPISWNGHTGRSG